MDFSLSVVAALLMVPLAYFAVTSAYLAVITAGAALPRRPRPPARQNWRIALLVPAHNEELILKETLLRFRKVDVPGTLTVIVLADNCTDRTVDIARECGAQVIERNVPELRGKGYALDWCFKQRAELFRDYDAVVIADADAVMQQDFLGHVLAPLDDPKIEAVQGYYGVSNAGESRRAALIALGFLLKNHIRNAGRSALGGSANLVGNGMSFRTQSLLASGWPTVTLGEDHEMAVLIALSGGKIEYAERAVLVSDMPVTATASSTQRARWDFSGFQLRRRYGIKLVRRAVMTRNLSCLDVALELSIPPLGLYGFLLATLAVASVFWGAGIPIVVAGSSAGLLAFHIIGGLVVGRAPRAVWLALLASPAIIVWRAPMYIMYIVRGGPKYFIRTRRER